MKSYESILAKCRKLAALADPNNGGSEGETENAKAMLERLMAEYSITAADFDPAHRKPYDLLCVSRRLRTKPVKEKQLVQLAAQCLGLVTGDPAASVRCRIVDYFTPQRGLKPDKLWRVYEVTAEVTEAEAQEWQECFQHYIEDFLETIAELRQQVRAANRALKFALHGFACRHNIFAPSNETESEKPLPPEKLAAILAAAQASKGEKWQRKAGQIDDGFFLK